MKLYAPALLVGGTNEIELLRNIVDNNIFEYDILVNYEYQRKHFEILRHYVNTELYDMFPAYRSFKKTVKKVKSSGWPDEFMYILTKFLQTQEYKKKDMKAWLKQPRKKFIITRNPKILRHYDLKKSYETVIIDMEEIDGNFWNRYYGLPANYYNSEVMVKKVLSRLREDGVVIFLNTKYIDIVRFTIEGYKEIEINIFRKLKTVEKKHRVPRFLL